MIPNGFDALAADLRAEATRTNQRRLLVVAGTRDAAIDAAFDALDAAGLRDEAAFVTTREGFAVDRHPPERADRLLGTTRGAVVLDAHEGFSPNVLGRIVGAVDGGGLLLLLTPPLGGWHERRGSFAEHLAVPPFDVGDVSGRFTRRLVRTLRSHPGVAIVDVDVGAVERDGRTDAAPEMRSSPAVPRGRKRAFPRAAYEACLTGDQSRAVRALERLRDPGNAVVVEADRGRGKSSAAGIAAGALAAEGRDVLVTAPTFDSAREVFVRAASLLTELGALAAREESAHRIKAAGGGGVRFADAPEAGGLPGDPDAVVVDEAAALPVRLLSSFLDAPAAAFCTTVHGYEGAGRGFAVRFLDRLRGSDLAVAEVRLDDPIRYARGDPVESFAFRALCLDAHPAADELVGAALPGTTDYRAYAPDDLLDDEHLLREAFGLLVFAHYRTEPNDLARLLDAPNLTLRALVHEGHVVSVALLAREGGLSAKTRRRMYDGGRVRGNMLPDVLTSQLRDEAAGVPAGYRVMRIATHHAVRSRGLGSRLLSEVRAEFDGEADWLGVGYGATPELIRFWERNGYSTVHLSTTRNDTSGEYSALMLLPLSTAGERLRDRHAGWFLDRAGGVLADPLRDLDPDVARAALRATAPAPDRDLSPREWRVVVGASYGPGMYDAAPDAFRTLALAWLTNGDAHPAGGDRVADAAGNDGTDGGGVDDGTDIGDGTDEEDGSGRRAALTPREERLLVRKVLQRHPWPLVADELGYVSPGQCMRAFGDALKPIVDRYGDEFAREEKRRYAGK